MAQDVKLLKRAYAPARLAMKYHPYYHGKIEISSKVPVNSYEDFAIWYTPGVAASCKVIEKNLDDNSNRQIVENFLSTIPVTPQAR